MYWGGDDGYKYLGDQRLWDSCKDRRQEEEKFLAQSIARMVGFQGKFSLEGLRWAIQEEQKLLGESYATFWEDWEDVVFAC